MANNVIFVFKAIDKKVVQTSRKIANSIGGITRQVNLLNRATDLAAAGFSRFRKAANNKLGNLVAGVGFVAGVRQFLSTGAQFQDAMADLEAITGATGESLTFLKDQTLDLARASAFSQDKVARAFKIIASAKSELLADPEGLVGVTRQVLLLANTGLDLETAANVTTEALNQFSAGSDQAARFVNVLAAGAKIGASEVNETGAALLKSGVVAKSVGVSFEGLNAAIQVLAQGGLKGEIAGTGLKTVLQRLEASGVKQLQPSVVGLSGALSNLNKLGPDLTQMGELVGTEFASLGLILSDNAAKVADWTQQVSGSNEAQRQAGVRLRTFSARMRQTGIVLSGKVLRVFERMEPAITRLGAQFGAWLDQVKPEQLEAFADSLALVVRAAGMVGKAFGKVLSVLKAIGEVIGEIAGAAATLDFSQFDTVKALSNKLDQSFLGGANTPGGLIMRTFTGPTTTQTFSGGMFSAAPPGAFAGPSGGTQKSQTNVAIDIKAPPGVVEKATRTSSGNVSGLNVGVNMVRN